MTRIFLVDDHEVVRQALAGVLDAQPEFEVVGEASTCREAFSRIVATCPDVAVLDVLLPDGSGIDLCRRIRRRQPHVQCLILTAIDGDDTMNDAVMADAAGYLLKTVRTADFTSAVRAVASGHRLLGSRMVRRESRRLRSSGNEDPRFGSLSLRERQVLALIAEGLTNRQIGARLGLAEKTVKNYVSSMLRKLGFSHRTQAAVFEFDRVHGTE